VLVAAKAWVLLLLFESVWKCMWFFAFGLPQYMSGQTPSTWPEDFKAIGIGVVAPSRHHQSSAEERLGTGHWTDTPFWLRNTPFFAKKPEKSPL
jgi:hypothetical protein